MCGIAFSEQVLPEGIDHDYPLNCPSFLSENVDQVVVRVTTTLGSYGSPVLIGLNKNTNVWNKPFPESEAVNIASLMVSCEENRVTLSFRNPGDSAWNNQHYVYVGKSIKFIRSTVTKPK
jgi:hypothetical protein